MVRGNGRKHSALAAGSFRGGLALLTLALWLFGAGRPLTTLPDQVENVAYTRAAPDHSEYAQALKAWTRSGSIYRYFGTELLITATYHSVAFRRAYVTAYAQAEQMNEGQKETLWQRQLAEVRESHEFLLAAFVPESEASDLANPGSGWRLYLETEVGDRVSPQDVRRIRKITPFITGFYPYVTPWAKVYKVRFSTRHPSSGDPFPGPVDQTLSLVITSPSGMVRLAWQPESRSLLTPPSDTRQHPGAEQTGQTRDQRPPPSPS